MENSKWFGQPNFVVITIESHNAISAGDALRLIYEQNVITLALLNARMSRTSYQNWSLQVILPLTSLLLSKFSLIVPLSKHYTRNPFSAAAGFTIYHSLLR
nr:translation initiation factor eIF-2B subunit epsilon [Ipomoea batatas]GMD32878.1 translation initiation factor eIF-2B subunit epsilon [Ipomoea batatas]